MALDLGGIRHKLFYLAAIVCMVSVHACIIMQLDYCSCIWYCLEVEAAALAAATQERLSDFPLQPQAYGPKRPGGLEARGGSTSCLTTLVQVFDSFAFH